MFLEPWCTQDPKRCAKYIGILDIIVSLAGLVVLFCLPLMILDLDAEVEYIQDVFGPQKPYTGNYTLVLNISYDAYDCDQVKDRIKLKYDKYLKDLDDSVKPFYIVVLNQSIAEANRDICVHYVAMNVKPSITVVNDTTMKSILIEAVLTLNSKLDANFIDNQIITEPNENETNTVQQTHLKEISNNPSKNQCITETMVKTTREIVHHQFVEMSNWLISAAVLAIFSSSILMIFESSWMGKLLLILCLILEVLCVIPLLIVFVMARNSQLCLLQYGGITPEGKNSPTNVQSIISYVSLAYALAFKGYSVLYLTAFYLKVDKQPSSRVSIATSVDTVHTIRSEKIKMDSGKKSSNRHNLIQRLLKKDEGEVESSPTTSAGVAGSPPVVSSDGDQEQKKEMPK